MQYEIQKGDSTWLEKDAADCDLYLTEVVSQGIFVLQAMTIKEEVLET